MIAGTRTPPIVGRHAPLPRPTARRLSDLNPYARIEAEDRNIRRLAGAAAVCLVLIVAALAVLGITL